MNNPYEIKDTYTFYYCRLGGHFWYIDSETDQFYFYDWVDSYRVPQEIFDKAVEKYCGCLD